MTPGTTASSSSSSSHQNPTTTTTTATTRVVGPVERLGQRSGPTPEAELHRSKVNIAWAGTRRGSFYERASSRQSRTKEALKRNGAISRDVAVPLGGGIRRGSTTSSGKRKHTDNVFQAEDLDKWAEQRGRERLMKIELANAERRSSLQQAQAGHTRATVTTAASVPSRKQAAANKRRAELILSYLKNEDKISSTRIRGKAHVNKVAKTSKVKRASRRRL